MSELTAALQAAVQSVDGDRHRDRIPSESPDHRPTRSVAMRRDEDALPPIAGRRDPSTFGGAVRESFGPGVAAVWTGVREAFLLVVTFWVAAILVAFAAAEQATLPVVLAATGALRLVLLAAGWTSRTVEARSSSTA